MLSKSVVMLLLALAKKSESQDGNPSGGGSGSSGPGASVPQGFTRDTYQPSGFGNQVYSSGPGAPQPQGFVRNGYRNQLYSSGPGALQPQGFMGGGYQPSGYGNQLYSSGPGSSYGYDNYQPYPGGGGGGAGVARYPGHYNQYPPAQGTPARPQDSLFLAKLFPIKIGLFALAKILLKILFFKKMIKFLFILGLLFILPAISSNLPNGFSRVPGGIPIGSFEQGFFRSLKSSKTDKEMMSDLKSFVKLSIEGFREKKKCSKDTKEFSCHMENMLNAIDKSYSFSRISKLFPGNETSIKAPPEDATKKETT